ncbi:hypothetical protein ATANTOWER_000700 [Ataeniobius toweri]|uniref:Uncharacterized protein n=1 Tax=Ataeniobius toweri TaxID=208326 RepID=A0ABU7BTJ8_9TELE|nr:hypothetical protein [Ataeniobius toweri]
MQGGAVGSTVALQQESPGFDSQLGLSAWSLNVLPVHAWILTRYSGFLPQSNDMTGRLSGLSKLPLGVNEFVHGCVSLYMSCMSLCCPAMDRRPVRGLPCLCP